MMLIAYFIWYLGVCGGLVGNISLVEHSVVLLLGLQDYLETRWNILKVKH